jgi:hypothetical protein
LGEDSKKKIYFEPYQDWLLENEKFYNQIYLPAYQKEQEFEPLPPVEKVVRRDEPLSPSFLHKEFYGLGQEAPPAEEGEIRTKIYGGRR